MSMARFGRSPHYNEMAHEQAEALQLAIEWSALVKRLLTEGYTDVYQRPDGTWGIVVDVHLAKVSEEEARLAESLFGRMNDA